MAENRQLPEGVTEADAALLVQGAQRYLSAPEPQEEELFYGTDTRLDPTGADRARPLPLS